MASAAGGRVAVTLSVAASLEERVVDWLLARPEVATFTTSARNRYGADSRYLHVAEQVSGRERQVELTLELPAGAVDDWLTELATSLPALEAAYRITPVLASGDLRERRG